MAFTIVGLFPSQENASKVSESLEKNGFKNSDYIVYLTQKNTEENKPSIWQRLFGTKQENFINVEEDKLITSVAINNEIEFNKAKETFEKNGVVHIYEFQDMTLEEAKSLDYVKKIVELRAKSHIYAMPEISTSSSTTNQGINAEVNIGK